VGERAGPGLEPARHPQPPVDLPARGEIGVGDAEDGHGPLEQWSIGERLGLSDRDERRAQRDFEPELGEQLRRADTRGEEAGVRLDRAGLGLDRAEAPARVRDPGHAHAGPHPAAEPLERAHESGCDERGVGVPVARAEGGADHLLGQRRGYRANGGVALQQGDLEPGGLLVVHQGADRSRLVLVAREAQVARAAIARRRIESRVQVGPEPHSLAGERKLGRVAPRLAHAAERPAGGHGGGPVGVEHLHRDARLREHVGRGEPGHARADDENVRPPHAARSAVASGRAAPTRCPEKRDSA